MDGTKKVHLRAPEPSDIDALYLWENSSETWRVSFNDGPVSRHQLWQYIENYSPDIAAHGQLRLIITDQDGTPEGTVDLSDYSHRHRRAQLGVYVAPRFRGKGVAADAVSQICEYARDTIGLHQIYAMCAIDNRASENMLRSAGFESCGRIRSYLRLQRDSYTDVLLFQKIL